MASTKLKEYLRVVAISIVGATVTTYFTCPECHNNTQTYGWVSLFVACLWISLWIGNGEMANILGSRISWMEFPVRRLIVGVIGTIVYTVSVVVIIIKLWEYFLEFNVGNSLQVVYFSLVITFLISLFLHGREFLRRWKAAEIDAERLQKENARAQYESLKSQVNPHFLFNSLNALTHLVYENQDKAAKFIKQLSEVYRYVLDSREKEVVSLAEELKFLDSYLFLQQIRFGEKLNVTIKLEGINSSVAPLALQMLVENAIKHNVISEEDPLHINVYQENSFIAVENVIRKKSMLEEGSPGLGLENIRKRYAFLSKKPVEVINKEDKFKVLLPMLLLPS